MTFWIDTHCHLDAAEFGTLAQSVRARAATENVAHCIIPAVEVANFETVRALAHAGGDSYALGIHPLYVRQAQDSDLATLDDCLHRYRDDPRLVAVGEIGLDYFVPELNQTELKARQEHFYLAQLRLAQKHGLPVILHVRRSADQLLKGLRDVASVRPRQPDASHPSKPVALPWRGIAHAFNGSAQQAQTFIALGFKLGFGGAMTYERAQQLRRLATTLPLDAMVLETDAPDMPPHWLYKTAEQRAAGEPQGVNQPAELPRIGAVLAALRGITPEALAEATTHNAFEALPKLRALLAQATVSR